MIPIAFLSLFIIVLAFLTLFLFPYKIEICPFKFCEECLNFGVNCIKCVYYFWWDEHFACIHPTNT